MADFKQNITNVSKEDKDKYYKSFKWKMPGDINKYIGERDEKRDTSMKGQKERLEGQLAKRKKYIELLEHYKICMEEYDENPVPILKTALEVAKNKIETHNIEIEITSQKNVYVDTYIYYKEDFMKRFNSGEQEKKINQYKK